MIVLPDMMSWPHFIQLPKMRNLPLNEQMQHYNRYLAEQQALYAVVVAQTTPAGSGGTQPVQEIPLPSNCIEFTVDTTNDTYFTFSFTTVGAINFTIDWGDGETYEGSGEGGPYSENHTYAESNQQYVVRVCFDNPSGVTSLDFPGND